MANLSDQGEEGVSLFPMFNILACTLDVMVFVPATVASGDLGDRLRELKDAQAALAPILGQLAGPIELRLTPVPAGGGDR
jgi:hypothetical protein